MSSTTTHLPQELIREIFTRLPVKTLFRFKIISKSYRSLIEEQSFIDSHTHQGLNNKPHLILQSHNDNDEETKFYSGQVDSLRLYDDIVKQIPSLPCVSSGDYFVWVKLVGSCNGLVCFTHYSGHISSILDKRIIIGNITTREYHVVPMEYKNLPDSGKDFLRPERHPIGCGFGYEPVGDDYKFVMIGNSLSVVYSLKKNQWTWKLHGSYLLCTIADGGVLVNGALHWLDRRSGNRIHSVDLQLEEYSEVPPPLDYYNSSASFISQVGVMGGCLILVGVGCLEAGEIQVWSMMEHMVGESWTKLYSIDLYLRSIYLPKFLLRTNDDEFLFLDTCIGALHLYKQVDKEPQRLRIAADNNKISSIDIAYMKKFKEVQVYQETLTRISYYIGQR